MPILKGFFGKNRLVKRRKSGFMFGGRAVRKGADRYMDTDNSNVRFGKSFRRRNGM